MLTREQVETIYRLHFGQHWSTHPRTGPVESSREARLFASAGRAGLRMGAFTRISGSVVD